jgi:hypothetical protein
LTASKKESPALGTLIAPTADNVRPTPDGVEEGSLALLEGRHDVALEYADSVRNIEDKPALRALAGTLERALAAASSGAPAEREQLFRTAFRAAPRAAVSCQST